MNSNIDTRENLFLKNIEFFKKYHPSIFLKLANTQDTKRFSLVSSHYNTKENSQVSLLNIQINSSKELAYQSNPIELAQTQATNALEHDSWVNFSNQIKKPTNIDKIICISNGLGYNLIEYDKYYNIKSLLIVEEDIELFKFSLFVTDYEKLCKNKSVIFCINEDNDTVQNIVLKFYSSLFFYNNSLKLAQFFNNNKMNYIISILQENLNESVENKQVNYDNIITNDITPQTLEPIYTQFLDNVFNKHLYTKEMMFNAINILNFINQYIDLQINNNKIANNIYCALYYITSIYKEKGFEHIQTNSFYVLAKSALLKTLQDEIYSRMITVFKKSKRTDLHIFFLENQINQYELKQNLTEDDKKLIEHKKYLLQAIKGEDLKQSNTQYVTKEFDDFANNFESVLVEKLQYDIPDKLNESITKYLQKDKTYNILDLGCGTGLLGEKLQAISNTLIGIDLSLEMIKQAKAKNIYTDLIQSDIEKFLILTITQNKIYDIFTAADVFVYIGDLNEIFNKISTCISKNGLFVFSIELLENTIKDYHLNPTGRFSHSVNYIQQLAKQFSFQILEEKQTTIRQELNTDVAGYIFILQKQ